MLIAYAPIEIFGQLKLVRSTLVRLIPRAAITAKGKISFRAAFTAKNMKSNSKAKIE